VKDALVAHHHELGLKGKNKDYFEQILARTLKRAMRQTGYTNIRRGFGRIVVDFGPDGQPDLAAERVARLYGIAYVGVGRRVEPDMDQIGDVALSFMTDEPFNSFRVRARRTHSNFEQTSQDIHETVGRRIQRATGGKVDLKHADATAWVELFGGTGIVYRRRIDGTGGLPAGVSGKMIALLSGGIDSPVAAWRMWRRGASIELLHFHGQPFTDPSSAHQAIELAQTLTNFHPEVTLHLVPLGDAQREIVTHTPSSLRVILYRRTMFRIAAELAVYRGAKALVTGDALGQVASQTIENITTVDAAVPNVQVIRPLAGMTKQEIIEDANRIGTYEISTRKYQDCCVLFEPRSPAIRARSWEAEEAEASLDVNALVGKSLAGIETRHFELPDPI
jgi:thiamine biosynthesis protein ThiI